MYSSSDVYLSSKKGWNWRHVYVSFFMNTYLKCNMPYDQGWMIKWLEGTFIMVVRENKLANGKWHSEGSLCLISSSPRFQIAKDITSFIRFHVLEFIPLNIPKFHSSVLILFSLQVVNKVQLGMFCLTTCVVWFWNCLFIYILVEM